MLKIVLLIVGIAAMVWLLTQLGFYISPKDDLRKSDVIVVLSGGNTRARTMEGVKLYQQGWAPQIIFSGAADDPKSASNAEVMRSIALEQGVPPDIITVEEHSRTTHQNANEVSIIMQAFHYKSLILVTSPYHQRRSYLEFKDRLDDSITIINHPAPDIWWDRRWWWITPTGWYLTVSELAKVGFTLINQQLQPSL